MSELKRFTPVYNMVSSDFFGRTAPSLLAVFNSDDYVTMPEVLAEDLEGVFSILNRNISESFGKFVRDLHETDPDYEKYPRLHTSMSSGDLVIDENGTYHFCAACGWIEMK